MILKITMFNKFITKWYCFSKNVKKLLLTDFIFIFFQLFSIKCSQIFYKKRSQIFIKQTYFLTSYYWISQNDLKILNFILIIISKKHKFEWVHTIIYLSLSWLVILVLVKIKYRCRKIMCCSSTDWTKNES